MRRRKHFGTVINCLRFQVSVIAVVRDDNMSNHGFSIVLLFRDADISLIESGKYHLVKCACFEHLPLYLSTFHIN